MIHYLEFLTFFTKYHNAKESWLIRAAALYSDYEVYVRLNTNTQIFKTCINTNLSAKLRMIQFMSTEDHYVMNFLEFA
jgi:hypothetical protein